MISIRRFPFFFLQRPILTNRLQRLPRKIQLPAEAPAEEAPAPAPAEEAAPAEASASEVKEVLEQAVDNAKDELVNIPASAPAEEPTIFEKYGNAFAMDQFDINCKF